MGGQPFDVSPPSSPLPPSDVTFAGLVDHTLLAAEATRADIERLCDEALARRFAAVCVNGGWVSLCARRLLGSGVKVATVVGFPLGATTSSAKAFEARNLVDEGADELDMVAPIGRLLDGDWDYVEADISGVIQSCGGRI
ncbi:MAG: deoxyribose-phosphate aldolase, partial [Gemmatimonadetes bacterium]|nr:deoxyribose-phosphate aldolase [Gemmatimonadota bacterium]